MLPGMGGESLGSIAARFDALYTGAITDVLDRRGFLQQTLPPTLAPLEPGMRLAGPAFTVEGRPRPGADYDESIRGTLAMLGSAPAGHVVVYQTNDSENAHLGELSVVSLASRGAVGAVIDGGCRDVELILREGFPVFARHTTPQDCTRRWEVTATEVPIEIGSVEIAPGDYIVADRDGIAVIPSGVRDAVLEEAEAKVATENEIRDAIRAGERPLAAYERYGTF
jgi:4-hydroxy-4-methyl-2-oxoglutarate aldolase